MKLNFFYKKEESSSSEHFLPLNFCCSLQAISLAFYTRSTAGSKIQNFSQNWFCQHEICRNRSVIFRILPSSCAMAVTWHNEWSVFVWFPKCGRRLSSISCNWYGWLSSWSFWRQEWVGREGLQMRIELC